MRNYRRDRRSPPGGRGSFLFSEISPLREKSTTPGGLCFLTGTRLGSIPRGLFNISKWWFNRKYSSGVSTGFAVAQRSEYENAQVIMLSKLRDATNSTQEKDSATSPGGSFPAETKPHRGKSAIPGGIFCYSRKSIYLKGET